MKAMCAAVAFLVALGCHASAAQTPNECKPSVTNIPEAKYPCVYPDNRAMFRVVAPDAQKVRVRIGQGFDMEKGPDGVWSVTTTPLVVGFHYYSLQIDGATIADPSTMTYFGSGWQNSAIEIPDPASDFYTPKDVPHGRVSQQWYFSKVTGKWRRSFVYTPPDYDTNTRGRLPSASGPREPGDGPTGSHSHGAGGARRLRMRPPSTTRSTCCFSALAQSKGLERRHSARR